MTDETSARPSKPLVDQFHDMLHRDHTGLVAGLNAVLGLVGGYQWARSSRGAYEWDDDRFHAEMGNMLDAVSKAANEALDRYRRGPLQCCVLERATPSETTEFPSVHVISVPWCQCCEAKVPADHICSCERAALKAFVHLCAPHGKDWLTCPECAKAADKMAVKEREGKL